MTRVPDLELRIIGDGESRAEVEQYIAEHHLEPYTRLLGYQPHQVFHEQLEEAHLFIQPSVTSENGDSEGGAPTVLLEAQACGVPVLATYHADIPEVVRDGESALLAPERDPESLAGKWLERCSTSDRTIGRQIPTGADAISIRHPSLNHPSPVTNDSCFRHRPYL